MPRKTYKKVISRFDGGIQTDIRDSSPETSVGAQMISHYDIYTNPNRLLPMPSWESFAATAEKAYNIRAVGGLSSTIYGIGKALTNWYGSAWAHRVKVTPVAAKHTGGGLPLRIDLSLMPADFWSHVRTSGSDIRVARSYGHQGIPFELENFDHAGQKGDLWIDGVASTDDIYVYYGNPTAPPVSNGLYSWPFPNQPMDVWDGSSMRFAFTFDGDRYNNHNIEEMMMTDPVYVSGFFGKAIDTGNSYIQTDNDDEVALTGSDISVSFMIKLLATPSGTVTILDDVNGTWSVSVTSARKISFYADGVTAGTTYTSTAALTVGQWYTVDCIYDGNYYIAINGSKETFTDTNGTFDDNATNNRLVINTHGICHLAQVWGFDNDISTADIVTKYNNLLDNANFWTIGAEEDFTSIQPVYSGVQVYSKSLTSGNWQEYLVMSQPAKSLAHHPVNGFVETDGTTIYFVTSTLEDDGGITFLSRVATPDGFAENHLLLYSFLNTNKVRPLSESPVDKTVYFNFGSSSLGSTGNPGSASEFTAYSTVTSLVPWRNYLAIGSTRRTRANIEIWDLVSASPLEFVDAGLGNLRVVGNASDILFAVVDNYIDDPVLSSGRPEMVVRQYVGNGRTEDVVRMEVPANYTGWTDVWERAVSSFRFRRDNQTLFYASIPADSAATEFYSGLWAVGKGMDGKLALSLMIDTSEFGRPENVYGFAKQAFFVEKDGGIQRLSSSGTYDKTSLYRTRWMNEGNNEIEKDLRGIEIACEPLEAGQTISVYYKANGDTDRTLIAEFSGENEIGFESVSLPDGTSLPSYREIHFDIESTGGGSAIREFNYKYQYLSDLV